MATPIDMNKALRLASNTGKVLFGAKQTADAAATGDVKLVVYATNAPRKDFSGAKTYKYPGTNADLGAACGKPFPVSCLAIVDPGDSQILTLGWSRDSTPKRRTR